MNKRGDFFVTILGVMACLLLATAITAVFLKYREVPTQGLLPAHILQSDSMLDLIQLQFNTLPQSIALYSYQLYYGGNVSKYTVDERTKCAYFNFTFVYTGDECYSNTLAIIESGVSQYFENQLKDVRLNRVTFETSHMQFFTKITDISKEKTTIVTGTREPIELMMIGQDSSVTSSDGEKWRILSKEEYVAYKTFVPANSAVRYATYLKRDNIYNLELNDITSNQLYQLSIMKEFDKYVTEYNEINKIFDGEKPITELQTYINQNEEFAQFNPIASTFAGYLIIQSQNNIALAYPLSSAN